MIGFDFFSSSNVVWRENQGGLLPLSPAFNLEAVDHRLAQFIRSKHSSLFLRWESGFDCQAETPWWHVIKDSFSEIEDLPKKTRYQIKKAANTYEAKPISREQVINDGYLVYLSAFERYETHEPIFSKDQFCAAISSLPDSTEFWAVFEKENQEMVAFSENYIELETCFYVTMWVDPAAMKKFASYLLFHKMEVHYLRDRRFRYVSDGSRSLSHNTNIHNFLISKFGFRKAFANLHVAYAPWLAVLVGFAYPFRNLISRVPFRPFMKAAVLLRQEQIRRFCAEGASQ